MSLLTKEPSENAPKSNEGEEINPHIPQFLAEAPWYLNDKSASLNHQRIHVTVEHLGTKKWYNRGQNALGAQAVKYRKGACRNCGAMGHDIKNCFERPRKVGAKYNNININRDDVLSDEKEVASDYDAKRDIWNGYIPEFYNDVHARFERTEEERKRFRLQSTKSATTGTSDDDDEVVDEMRQDESKTDTTSVASVDPKTRTAIRNLRIREDTAKYLYNLDVNSAYYDPKTRSMREDPNPLNSMSKKGDGEDEYHGDNWVRYTGDSSVYDSVQLFSFQSMKQHGALDPSNSGTGTETNPDNAGKAAGGDDSSSSSSSSAPPSGQADIPQVYNHVASPSLTELAHQRYIKEQMRLNTERRNRIYGKYGGLEHNLPGTAGAVSSSSSVASEEEALMKQLILGQTEEYFEYAPDGSIKDPNAPSFSSLPSSSSSSSSSHSNKTASNASTALGIARSRYEEDVLPNNHTCVYGSYWDRGKWGYLCCYQFERNSYCTGAKGRMAYRVQIGATQEEEEEEEAAVEVVMAKKKEMVMRMLGLAREMELAKEKEKEKEKEKKGGGKKKRDGKKTVRDEEGDAEEVEKEREEETLEEKEAAARKWEENKKLLDLRKKKRKRDEVENRDGEGDD